MIQETGQGPGLALSTGDRAEQEQEDRGQPALPEHPVILVVALSPRKMWFSWQVRKSPQKTDCELDVQSQKGNSVELTLSPRNSGYEASTGRSPQPP